MGGFGELQRRLRAGSGYKWWVLGLVMLGTFMAVLDVTVVNVGIPTIMSAFHIGISSAEWIVTAYMITMTIMLPSSGWIALLLRAQTTTCPWSLLPLPLRLSPTMPRPTP